MAKLNTATKQKKEKPPVVLPLVRCLEHGPQYACEKAAASGQAICDHLACKSVIRGVCPECRDNLPE